MLTSSDRQWHYDKGPPFTGIELDWWDYLETHPTARLMRAIALGDLHLALRAQASANRLTVATIVRWHKRIFGGAFPELSGVTRGQPPEGIRADSTFGRRRGVPFQDVGDALEEFDKYLIVLLHQLDEAAPGVKIGSKEFRRLVIEGASVAHCELIRIHPFVNGNGRTARMCINYFMLCYGFSPIPIERPKGEYVSKIDDWILSRDLGPMADFLDALADETEAAAQH